MDFSISFVDLAGAPRNFFAGGESFTGSRVADWYFSPNGPWGTGPAVEAARVFVDVKKSSVDLAVLAVFDGRAYWEQGRLEGSFQYDPKSQKTHRRC